MSLAVTEETKDDSTTPSTTTMNKSTKTKKKKKKKTILYQQTAIKYFDGFMKNKRYKKGINLSTGCAIFKTAWELPEINGLVLPSRVLRHFKQVLPKKPKQNKNKKKKKNNTQPNHDDIKTATDPSTNTINDNNNNNNNNNEEPEEEKLPRARTMMNIKGVETLNFNLGINNIIDNKQQFQRRTMLATSINTNNSSLKTKKEIHFDDTIEDVIDHNIYDESNNTPKDIKQHITSKSSDNLVYNINVDVINSHAKSSLLATSDTPVTPDVHVITPDAFDDHADIRMEDMKPDVEETPMLDKRAETDIQNMHHDVVSFKVEIMKEEKKNKEKDIKEEKEEKQNSKPPTKKKKKKKNPILYAEPAIRLFKKISDGKRLKNGITLKKACNIFAVAWELPEENGRILPSKVARHFKQVLPSKKTKDKTNKNKNIKPSVAKSRTHRDNISVSVHKNGNNKIENGNPTKDSFARPRGQTMRGHLNVNIGQHQVIRSANQLPPMRSIMMNNNETKPKKSTVEHLESLISSDPNRSNSNDNAKNQIKRKKAGSMTDLDLDITKINNDEIDMENDDEDQIVENEIEGLIKEKQKIKEKEKDAIDAIEAAFN